MNDMLFHSLELLTNSIKNAHVHNLYTRGFQKRINNFVKINTVLSSHQFIENRNDLSIKLFFVVA